jgi:hypothetical protein
MLKFVARCLGTAAGVGAGMEFMPRYPHMDVWAVVSLFLGAVLLYATALGLEEQRNK